MFGLVGKRKELNIQTVRESGMPWGLQERLESWPQVGPEPSPSVLRFGFFLHIGSFHLTSESSPCVRGNVCPQLLIVAISTNGETLPVTLFLV